MMIAFARSGLGLKGFVDVREVAGAVCGCLVARGGAVTVLGAAEMGSRDLVDPVAVPRIDPVRDGAAENDEPRENEIPGPTGRRDPRTVCPVEDTEPRADATDRGRDSRALDEVDLLGESRDSEGAELDRPDADRHDPDRERTDEAVGCFAAVS